MVKKKRVSGSNLSFNVIGYVYVVFFTVICIVPFWLLIVGSFTPENEIANSGFSFWPKAFSNSAYLYIFKNPDLILNGYKTTLIVTIVGTVLSLFMTTLAGYIVSRKNYVLAGKLSMYFYFTTLFSGGLLPYYILMVRFLHLRDTYAALIIPLILSPFNIIVVKSFMSQIPYEIYESAKCDGANEFSIYSKIYLPMMKPCIATIGLFVALSAWNNWSNAMLYINDSKKFPLAYLLAQINASMSANAQQGMSDAGVDLNLPTKSVQLAMAVVSTGPIIFLYPFAQKYFVEGLTIGAVKG